MTELPDFLPLHLPDEIEAMHEAAAAEARALRLLFEAKGRYPRVSPIDWEAVLEDHRYLKRRDRENVRAANYRARKKAGEL